MAGVDIIRFIGSCDRSAEYSAAAVKVGFGNDKIPDLVSKQLGCFYGDGATHAVPVDIDLPETPFLYEAMNLQRMVVDAISETFRAITEAKAE